MRHALIIAALWFAPCAAQAQPADTFCGAGELRARAVIEQNSLQFEFLPVDGIRELAGLAPLHTFRQAGRESDSLAALADGRIVAGSFRGKALHVETLIEKTNCTGTCRLSIGDLDFNGLDDLIVQDRSSGTVRTWFAMPGGGFTEHDLGSLDGRVVGVLNADKQRQPMLIEFIEEVGGKPYGFASFYTFDAAAGFAHHQQSLVGDISPQARLVRLGPGRKTYVSTFRQTAHRGHWHSTGMFLNNFSQGTMVEFYPKSFDWYGNHTWSDINGDGLIDLASFPEESRQIWIGLNRSSVQDVLLELPSKMEPLPAGLHRLVGGGDFTGDGIGELLLCSAGQGACRLGISRAARPARNMDFRFGSRRFSSDSKGLFCLDSAAAELPAAVLSERYGIDNIERYAGSVWLRLALRSPRKGAFFDLGRMTEPPYICSSYNPSIFSSMPAFPTSKWGLMNFGTCATSHAIYFTDDISGFSNTTSPSAICCPLPAKDIVSRFRDVPDPKLCPDGHIAAGIRFIDPAKDRQRRFTCREINSERYQLGPLTSGVYWGHGFSVGLFEDRLRWDQLPAAIRSGARTHFQAMDVDGCTGVPPGSLFVGFGDGRRCEGHLYRQLQYRGAPGDPPTGTPVQMFPDCDDVQEMYSPLGACRNSVRDGEAP